MSLKWYDSDLCLLHRVTNVHTVKQRYIFFDIPTSLQKYKIIKHRISLMATYVWTLVSP